MEVMGTQQMYQKMNQVRQLMNAYIKDKKLQVLSLMCLNPKMHSKFVAGGWSYYS